MNSHVAGITIITGVHDWSGLLYVQWHHPCINIMCTAILSNTWVLATLPFVLCRISSSPDHCRLSTLSKIHHVCQWRSHRSAVHLFGYFVKIKWT